MIISLFKIPGSCSVSRKSKDIKKIKNVCHSTGLAHVKNRMKNILLVEDDKELRLILKMAISLRMKDIHIAKASSGLEGLSFFLNASSFDIVISDYSMANGNGQFLLEELTKIGANSFFILHTSFPGLQIETTNPKFLGVIDKFNFDGLIEKIQRSLEIEILP